MISSESESTQPAGATSVNKTMRPAAVAGRFYPDAADELHQQVERMLATARSLQPVSDDLPKALIVPHAGYRYSGQIAAMAYQQLERAPRRISRVVLIGPAHRVRFEGLGMSGADYFSTPLGTIAIDCATVRQCCARYSFVRINNKAHQQEHSLETQ